MNVPRPRNAEHTGNRNVFNKVHTVLEVSGLSMEEKMETTLNLPYSVLVKIFGYLKSIERQNLRGVCSAWEEVMTQFFEVIYCLNNGTWKALVGTREVRPLFINAKVSSTPTCSCVAFPNNNLEYFNTFCKRIQKLEFFTMDFNLTCMKILQTAESVRELVFNSVQFQESPNIGELLLAYSKEVKTWLPMLTKLEFRNSTHELLNVIQQMVQNGKLIELHIDSAVLRRGLDQMLQEYVRDGIKVLASTNGYTKTVDTIINSNKTNLRSISNGVSGITFNPTGSLQKWSIHVEPRGGLTELDHQIAGNWLEIMRQGNKHIGLSELKYQLVYPFGLAITGAEIEASRRVELLIYHVITHWPEQFTKIELNFFGKFNLEPVWATENDGVFSKCVSLKHLEFSYYRYELIGNNPVRPVFKGIKTLPRSLEYFRTDLPIHNFSENNLQDLNLENLLNLRTLKLCSMLKEWFIFRVKNVVQFTAEDVRVLSRKLPKLETLSFTLNCLHHTKQINESGFNGLGYVDDYFVNATKKKLFDTRGGGGNLCYSWTLTRSNSFKPTNCPIPHENQILEIA